MTLSPAADLDALRDRLSDPHRDFVSALWRFFRDHNQWVPSRIAHQHFGKDAVQACVDVAADYGGSCFVVAEMSHPGATQFFHGGTAEQIAGLAVECGADGIIAPATRPERVKALRVIVGKRKILSPGVGAQGGDAAEVARIVDGIIVGRAIYEAEDPAAAAESFAGLRTR